MSRIKDLGSNILYVMIGNAGAKLLSLLMLPFYTRWLSVEQYGIIDMLGVYSTLLMGFVSCCIYDSIFVFPKQATKEKQQEYYTSGVVFSFLSILFFLIVSIVIHFVSDIYNIYNSFCDYIYYIFAILVFTFCQTYTQEFCRSIGAMKVYSSSGIVLAALMVVSSFILVPKYHIEGYVSSVIISNILTLLYSVIFSRSYTYFRINKFCRCALMEMLKYSVPLIPNAVMWWVVGASNRPIMEQYVGIYAIGIFAVAGKFPNLINSFLTMFTKAWQISVLDEYKKEGFGVFFYKVIFSFSFILGIVCIIVGFCSFPLVKLFTGEEFIDAWHFIPLLCAANLLSCVSSLVGVLFSALKNSKYYFYSSVCAALTAVVSNFILIPILGLYGASLSVVLSFGAMFAVRIYYGNIYFKVKNKFHFIELIIVPLMILFIIPTGLFIWYKIAIILFLIVCHFLMNVQMLKDFYCLITEISISR